MKVFAIDAYQAALRPREMPDPVAGPGEVVVAIAAASVNPLDVKLREGEFKRVLPYRMPLVLGHDLAGTVVAVGPDTRRFKVGDEVFGCAGTGRIGSFAEHIAVAKTDLAAKPASLGMVEAAALPLVSLTAWQVLLDRAKLRPGQLVLIHAGSGGVGTVAIQLARHLGAQLATTVGTDNLALANELGADLVIDYHHEAFEQRLSAYDDVLNTLGPEVLEKSLKVLKAGGKLISITGPPDLGFARQIGAGCLVRQLLGLVSFKIRSKAKKRGVDYSFHFMRADGGQLAEIAKLVDAGAIRPVIDQVFAFDETPVAMARVASGRARGKVVIRVAPDLAASGAKR
jgi:NADPH:quinone reductase-like Zn-dependent oxidoreductase